MTRPIAGGRRALGAAAAVCLALGGVIGAASTAHAAKPIVTATATVTGDDAQVSVAVNRGVNQIRHATCTLDGSAVDCGPPLADGKKAATYVISLTDLSVGNHELAVSVRLTDGGLATGSTTFESFAPPATPQSVCADTGGLYVTHLTTWQCRWHFDTAEEATSSGGSLVAAISPFCRGWVTIGYQVQADPAGGFAGYASCWRDTTWQMRSTCGATDSARTTYTWDPDRFSCFTPNFSPDAGNALALLCADLGGVMSRNPSATEVDYTCAAA